MSKEEAISLMKSGHKLTHRYFTEDEWVKSDSTGMVYMLDDGVEFSKNEFWKWRNGESWQSDWSILTK